MTPHVSELGLRATDRWDFIVPAQEPGYNEDGRPVDYWVARQLYRFTRDGTEVLNPSGGAWFSAYAYEYKYAPWQRVVLDAEHNRLFVLYNMVPAGSTETQHRFSLAAHDLQTGEKLVSWSGSRHVGSSAALRGGLAVDSTGNAWTALETAHGQVGIELKRWDGQNGANTTPNVTPPYDFLPIFSPDPTVDRHFVALAIPQRSDRLYLAYSEARQASVTKDLVLSLWSASGQFLDKKEFFETLPAPPGLPGVPAGATAHPVFTDGVTGDDGSMSIGGLHGLEGSMGDRPATFAFPVLFRFRIDGDRLSLQWAYRETGQYVLNASDVRLAKAASLSTWLMPDSGESDTAPVFGVSATGTLARFTYLRHPFGENAVESPPGSRCYYRTTYWPHGIIAGRTGPAMSGNMRKSLVTGSQPGCPQSGDWGGFVATYYNGLRLVCCVLRPFEWAEAYSLPLSMGMGLHARLLGSEPQDRGAAAAMDPMAAGGGRRVSKEPRQYEMLSILRDVRTLVERKHPVESFGGLVERVAAALQKAPVGQAFDKELQADVVGALGGLGSQRPLTPDVRGKLVEAAQALALDRQVGALAVGRGVVATGGVPAVSDVEWTARGDSAKRGTLFVAARRGIPALAEGFEPAWPLATYHLEFAGDVSEKRPILVGFRESEFGFGREVNAVRVLEWDGKAYRDITEDGDGRKSYATGRVTSSTDLVLMGVPAVAGAVAGN